MVVRSDAGNMKKAGSAGAITASPTAKLTYDSPAVSTYSPPTGWSAPAGNVQPYSNMPAAGSQQTWSAPANTWLNAPPQQAPATFAPPAPAPPMEPPRPQFAPGGRQEFNSFSPEQQQMTQDQWLAGDSDYTEQTGLYQKALDDFVRRITGRIEGFDLDAKDATAGNIKNQNMSADSLGADFGARGLSYSGLWDQSKNKLLDRYAQGRGNIEKNRATNVQNAKNEQADYTAENEIARKNSLRSSLLRMAAQQQLLDSQYGG